MKNSGKSNPKIREIKSLHAENIDKLSLPFNNTSDQVKPEEPALKIKPLNKKILHNTSLTKTPMSVQKARSIIDEENGVREALRLGKIKSSISDNKKEMNKDK